MLKGYRFTRCLVILFSVVVLLAASSCKKLQGEGRTVVEGQAVDKHTGKPVPFAKLYILSQPGSLAYGYNTTELEKQADAQGKFDFSFEASSDKNYGLVGGVDYQHSSGIGGMVKLDNARRNRDLKLKMKPWAWARIKFINEPPYDTAWFYMTGTFFHDDDKGQRGFELNMSFRDITVVRALEGSQTSQLYWSIKKGFNTTEYRKDVFFPGLDTTLVEIRY